MEPEDFGIGQALEELRAGRSVCRRGWNGKGMYLTLQVPDANSKMTQPYVFITPALGCRLPWVCSQADLLASDWRVCSVGLST